MNICLIGDGLASLTLAKNLINKNIKVDICYENRKKPHFNSRTIGISKDKVIDYISMPDNIDFITSSLDSYEIWIYTDFNKKLFFKNNKLHHIQSIKE